jgi:hypothetical protein
MARVFLRTTVGDEGFVREKLLLASYLLKEIE